MATLTTGCVVETRAGTMKARTSWLRSTAILVLGVLILAGATCARHPANVVDHTVWMGADKELVFDYQITYGQLKFPDQPGDFGNFGSHSYTMTMPVPEIATVEWTTADRQRHRETIEVWRHVKDQAWFFKGRGKIQFEVDGPVLRVYRVRWISNDKRPVREQIHLTKQACRTTSTTGCAVEAARRACATQPRRSGSASA